MNAKTTPKKVELSVRQVIAGQTQIRDICVQYGITLTPDGAGYEPVFVDSMEETQGGWYAEFDKKMRERLRESKLVSWRNIGMVTDESLEGLLENIKRLGTRLRGQNRVDPETGKTKTETLIEMKIVNTKKALETFNSTGALTDAELNLCIKHYQALDLLIKTDPMLGLARPYVSLNLQVLEGYKDARKGK